MAQITARFRVVGGVGRKTMDDIVLRATKQSDTPNSENPILWREDDSSQNEIHLRIRRDQAVGVFAKGKDVLVTFNGPT